MISKEETITSRVFKLNSLMAFTKKELSYLFQKGVQEDEYVSFDINEEDEIVIRIGYETKS